MMAGLLLGCTASDPGLMVLAASSMTEVMAVLAETHENAHPGVSVQVALGGSQLLAAQLRAGVQADVFVSANATVVEGLEADGLLLDATPFATNTLAVVVREGVAVHDLAGLATVERVVLGVLGSPIGDYTEQLLVGGEALYGPAWGEAVRDRVVSREPNTRLVLAKVLLGEADAAVVYATDVPPATPLRSLSIPDSVMPEVTFFQAVTSSGQAGLAADWQGLVLGREGQAVLLDAGFGVIPP